LILLSLLAASGSGGAASIVRPSWTAGDFWSYRTNTTVVAGLNLTGTATSTVSGTVAVVNGGAAVDAWRLILTGSGTASGVVSTQSGPISVEGSWIVTGEERLEPTNLHPLYSLLDLSVNGTYGGLFPFSLRFQNTTTYQIVSDAWRYPLVVGAAGNTTVAYNFTQDLYSPILGQFHRNGTGQAGFAFSLGGAVSVATGAGTFQAYPLREDAPDGTWQRFYVSPAVGNDVRTETYDSNGNLTAVETLVAYRYQAAEPPAFLGLALDAWAILAVVVAAVAVAAVLLTWRARRKKTKPTLGTESDEDPTSGPRGP
jgi:hypothetical protein